MGLDPDVVPVGTDGAARADLDALVAALARRAAVGADLFPVLEETRLFEFSDQRRELLRRERLLERIVAGREVSLRQLLRAQERLARKVEYQVEALSPRRVLARKIDGADVSAGRDAVALVGAFRRIDLVAEVDRAFGTGANAGVASRADFEIDGVVLTPLHLECAQPARNRSRLARPGRKPALERQLARPGQQYVHLE